MDDADGIQRRMAELLDHELGNRASEVLNCISRGLSENETHVELNMSLYTVREHKKTIFRALNARNAAHAVQRAHEVGWLKTDRTTELDPRLVFGLLANLQESVRSVVLGYFNSDWPITAPARTATPSPTEDASW